MNLSNKRKRNVGLILAALILLLIMVTPAAAITWGEPDGNGHPGVGLISVKSIVHPGTRIPFCSGLLIDKKVVLTAAHCTDFLQKYIEIDRVKVSFDSDDALYDHLIGVKKFITHPEFDSQHQSNSSDIHDVGLIILKGSGGNTSVEFPSDGFLDDLEASGKLDNAEFLTVGYGTTLEISPPELIDPDGQRRVAKSGFQALQKYFLRLNQNNNKDSDQGGTCSGDSGGPVYWVEADGTEIPVGITSWGDANCVTAGYYYRIDRQKVLDWIDANSP